MEKPLVSVILVSYNSQKYILECLNSLRKQKYNNFNIILVDNDSSEGSLEIAKKVIPEILVIRNGRNVGYAKACNLGIQKAFKDSNIKYVVCLNIDTTVDKNWLKELVSVAEYYPDFGSIQSKILLYDQPHKINTAKNNLTFLGFGYCGNYLEPSSNKRGIEEIPYSSGTSVLFNRMALEKTGFFDEDYFLYHEDVDLGLRLRLSGFKNILAPNSICYHKYSFSKPKKIYFLERNRLITIYKNFSSRTLFLILFAFLINEIGLLLFFFFRGNFMSKVKSYFYIISNFRMIHQKRKIVQKKRSVYDKEIAALITCKVEFPELDYSILRKFVNLFNCIYWKIVKKQIR